MRHQPQIRFSDIDETEAIRGAIEKHVQRLERFFPRIVGCRVSVAAPHRHHRKGNPYQVRVDVSVPGKEIIVNPHRRAGGSHDDLYIAISDTFNATIRRLQDYVLKRRGDVKHHEFPLRRETPARNEPVAEL